MNKVRTLLSLLGITIGIFSIISVFTAVDSMESYIRSNINILGDRTIFISRWPWGPEEGDNGEYKWWKFMNRARLTEAEYVNLSSHFEKDIDASTFGVGFTRNLRYDKKEQNDVTIVGTTYEYHNIFPMEIAGGRYFSELEINSGSSVTILGATIAKELFDGEYPIGKQIKLDGHNVTVIGVIKEEGNNMFGASNDERVLIPLDYVKKITSFKWLDPDIMLKMKDGVDFFDFKAELDFVLRNLRRQPFEQESSFSLNEVDAISNRLDKMFAMIGLVGGIIGIFSILVGGFGVANIMFVSVRERTSQIGIQKALGAKAYAILTQFIFEAILLSITGGALGLFFIWIATVITNSLIDFPIVMTLENVIIGLSISSIVGCIAGFFPAWQASRLSPVQAIYKTT